MLYVFPRKVSRPDATGCRGAGKPSRASLFRKTGKGAHTEEAYQFA